SGSAVLRRKDFEQMSAQELAEAEQAVADLSLPVRPLPGRRMRRRPQGRTDPPATLRHALRQGGEIVDIRRRAPAPRLPDLVALCDVSGSMSVYARMMMRYLHALTHARQRDWRAVHAFTFGTSLTNVTRALASRDPDAALSRAGQDVTDWEGGTRIGESLLAFNKHWSRRVLGRGAVVLLISDGLERGDLDMLRQQGERLALSTRRLVWLNPLLRFGGFEPLAGGARTLMPLVDSVHTCHSLDGLADLSRAISTPAPRR
ncbi:MAG: vWA domain-containing protein, partial [Marinibacterium sp.]